VVLTDVRWCGDGRVRPPSTPRRTCRARCGVDLERWRSGVGGGGGGGGAASAVDSKVVAEGMRQAFGGDPDTGRWRLTERSRYQLRRPHRSARPAMDV